MSPPVKKSAPKRTSTTKTRTASKAAPARKKAASPKRAASTQSPPVYMTREERWRMVAEAAYHKAEKRGFASGHEVEDWLDAEREIDALFGGKK